MLSVPSPTEASQVILESWPSIYIGHPYENPWWEWNSSWTLFTSPQDLRSSKYIWCPSEGIKQRCICIAHSPQDWSKLTVGTISRFKKFEKGVSSTGPLSDDHSSNPLSVDYCHCFKLLALPPTFTQPRFSTCISVAATFRKFISSADIQSL